MNKILKLELRKLAALLISLTLFAAFFLFSLKSPKAIHLPKIKPPKIQVQGKFKRMDPCSFQIRAFFEFFLQVPSVDLIKIDFLQSSLD